MRRDEWRMCESVARVWAEERPQRQQEEQPGKGEAVGGRGRVWWWGVVALVAMPQNSSRAAGIESHSVLTSPVSSLRCLLACFVNALSVTRDAGMWARHHGGAGTGRAPLRSLVGAIWRTDGFRLTVSQLETLSVEPLVTSIALLEHRAGKLVVRQPTNRALPLLRSSHPFLVSRSAQHEGKARRFRARFLAWWGGRGVPGSHWNHQGCLLSGHGCVCTSSGAVWGWDKNCPHAHTQKDGSSKLNGRR